MISGANVISSITATRDDYLSMPKDVGISLGLADLAAMERIFDGTSTVWIRLMSTDEAGYDESELEEIEEFLSGPAKTFILFEYDGGITAVSNILKIVKEIEKRWPIIFDNCQDRVYGATEIDGLVAKGQF